MAVNLLGSLLLQELIPLSLGPSYKLTSFEVLHIGKLLRLVTAKSSRKFYRWLDDDYDGRQGEVGVLACGRLMCVKEAGAIQRERVFLLALSSSALIEKILKSKVTNRKSLVKS